MLWQLKYGNESSPHILSRFYAGIATALFWVIFTVCAILIKPAAKKPKYEIVQIVLDAPKYNENKEKGEEAAAMPAGEEVVTESSSEQIHLPMEEIPVVEEVSPVEQKNVETPKVVEQPKPSVKTETTPVKTETKKAAAKTEPAPVAKPKTEPKTYSPELVKSVEELMEEQAQKKVASKAPSWDDFFDDDEDDDLPQTQNKVNMSNSVFEGSAAKVADTSSQSQKSSDTKSSSNVAATKQTSAALANLKEISYSSATGDALKSITNIKSVKVGSGVSIAMTDGSSRTLLEPSIPVIKLSSAAAKEVDSDRTVTITFSVMENGNVPSGQISITPAAILTQLVRDEIIAQISKWRFETADLQAKATFEYTIVVR